MKKIEIDDITYEEISFSKETIFYSIFVVILACSISILFLFKINLNSAFSFTLSKGNFSNQIEVLLALYLGCSICISIFILYFQLDIANNLISRELKYEANKKYLNLYEVMYIDNMVHYKNSPPHDMNGVFDMGEDERQYDMFIAKTLELEEKRRTVLAHCAYKYIIPIFSFLSITYVTGDYLEPTYLKWVLLLVMFSSIAFTSIFSIIKLKKSKNLFTAKK